MIQFKAKTQNGEVINSALSPFTFPAGEVHIKKEEHRELEVIEIAVLQADVDFHKDLFMLQAWDNLIQQENKGTYRVAVIPYFPGTRADHNFPKTVDIYTGVLAATQIDEVIIFDPHSAVVVDTLKKLPELKVTVYNPLDVMTLVYNRQIMPHIYSGVIAPDKGAVDRAQEVAKYLDVPLFKAEKVRNQETGKLSDFKCEKLPDNGTMLVVDDICDGGGTFAGLMGAIGHRKGETHLFISHGVFSGQALATLGDKFDKVFTTNSYNPRRTLRLIDFKGNELPEYENKFHRLNIITMMLENIKLPVIEELKIDHTAYYEAVYHTPLGQRMPNRDNFVK